MLILCLSFVIVFLDQLTKHVAMTRLRLVGSSHEVIPGFFDLSLVLNTGAAWGILAGLNHWLVALSFIMLLVIVVFRRHFLGESRLCRWAMGLMVGGIVGNLIDRVRLGDVVDFVDLHWKGRHFPAFNVADSAICVGVGLYVVAQWLGARGKVPAAEAGL